MNLEALLDDAVIDGIHILTGHRAHATAAGVQLTAGGATVEVVIRGRFVECLACQAACPHAALVAVLVKMAGGR